MGFKKLLKKHCIKSDKKMYFDFHKIQDVYKHECNLYFCLREKSVGVFKLSAPYEIISNEDWMFTFTDVKPFKMFLKALSLNAQSEELISEQEKVKQKFLLEVEILSRINPYVTSYSDKTDTNYEEYTFNKNSLIKMALALFKEY